MMIGVEHIVLNSSLFCKGVFEKRSEDNTCWILRLKILVVTALRETFTTCAEVYRKNSERRKVGEKRSPLFLSGMSGMSGPT